ncbi:unnamed protein product [Lactuca saligna]|uniref:Uncharacterized protein n=1 Tax=Lactuca saligna TaxID=75948 RepID=A0AA35VCB5_LACSI|nr:unnamed protein product [Lactuca saligna]
MEDNLGLGLYKNRIYLLAKCLDVISEVILVEVKGKEYKVGVKEAVKWKPSFEVENPIVSDNEEPIVQEHFQVESEGNLRSLKVDVEEEVKMSHRNQLEVL